MDEFFKIVTYLLRRRTYLALLTAFSVLAFLALSQLSTSQYVATVAYEKNVLPSQFMLFCGFAESCVDRKLSEELKEYLANNNSIGFEDSTVDLNRNYVVLSFDFEVDNSEIEYYFYNTNINISSTILTDEESFLSNIDALVDKESNFYGNNFLPSLKINAHTTIDELSKDGHYAFNFHLINFQQSGMNVLVRILASLGFGIFLSTSVLIFQYELTRWRNGR